MSNLISNPLFKALLWVVAGLFIGLVISMLFFNSQTQQPQSSILSVSLPNSTINQSLNDSNPSNTSQQIAFSQKLILAPNCDVCNSIDPVFTGLETYSNSTGIKLDPILRLDSTSPEARSFISKYSITKLPVIILTPKCNISETAFSDLVSAGFSKDSDGSVILREIKVPYYEISSSKPVGFVSAIVIKPTSCADCMAPEGYFNTLEQDGINFYFSNKTILDENTSTAQTLIAQYNITKLPALFLSSDSSYYPSFEFLSKIGTVEGQWFVLRNVTPPYVDLTKNHSVMGNVGSILLVNSSCSDCFNVTALSDYITTSAHMHIVNTTIIETNSSAGVRLISKYNLTYIPTVLYSPEADAYPLFADSWLRQGSSKEADGWFIFRSHLLLTNSTFQTLNASRN